MTNLSESTPAFPKLGEDNYSTWSRNMKAYLMQKKVWGIVSGKDPKPSPGDAILRDWLKDEGVASGLIYLGVEDGQKSQIEDFLDDPKKMWETLEAIHVQKRPTTRFIAYNSLLSITKQDDESLPSLTSRIEKSMQEIKSLRPKAFTIDDLDDDLVSMTMVRSLPSEYQSLVSSLILLPQFDFKTIKEAFINEELTRKASLSSPGVTEAANFTKSSQKRQGNSKTSSSSSSKPTCDFCNLQGHIQADCHRYKSFQLKARQEAEEVCQNRRKNGSKSSPATNTQSSANATSEQASLTQDGEKVEEFAGNASTTLSDSLNSQSSLSLCWCADTGASSHMTPHRAWFETYKPHSVPIRVADGTVVKSAGIGSVRFLPRLQGAQSREVVFHRVLHVPSLQNNLLSVLYLTSKQGLQVVAENHTMRFECEGTLLFTATQHGQLAYLDGSVLHPHVAMSAASASLLPLTLDLWHRRLAHTPEAVLKHLLANGNVIGLHIDSSVSSDPVCEPCIAGKQHRIINKTATRSTVPLEIVHCDR